MSKIISITCACAFLACVYLSTTTVVDAKNVGASPPSSDVPTPFSERVRHIRGVTDARDAVAELETNLRKERQAEGIELAKKRGAYKGRKASIEADKIIELRDGGLGATAIAKTLGISRASVYRLMTDKAA